MPSKKPIALADAFERLSFFAGRSPESTATELENAFAEIAPYRDGAVFIGHYAGDSEWERHSNGDEIVFVVEGETLMTLVTDTGEVETRLGAGELLVVPQGCWHRFHTPRGVKILTVTPQPTDHRIDPPVD